MTFYGFYFIRLCMLRRFWTLVVKTKFLDKLNYISILYIIIAICIRTQWCGQFPVLEL